MRMPADDHTDREEVTGMDNFRKWLEEQGRDAGFCAEYDRLYAEYEQAESQSSADMTLEESFSRLDEVMEKLEDRSLPLEEALVLYRQGMDLLARCNEKIDMAEKKVLVVNEEGDLDEF